MQKWKCKNAQIVKKLKLVTDFYIQSTILGIRQKFCKECAKKRKDILAVKKADDLACRPEGEKRECRTCHASKEVTEFYVSSRDGNYAGTAKIALVLKTK